MRFSGMQRTSATDYPGEVCSILFTPGCILRCHYCYNPELVLPEKMKAAKDLMKEDDVIEKLEQRKNLVGAVTITGGEVTIHKGLTSFIRKLKDRGFKVKVDTNGTHPEMLEKIIPLVDYIAMDVKATLDPEHYRKTVGVEFDVERIRKSISMIMESGVDYEFRTTVLPSLFPLESFERLSQELAGARRYFIQQFMPGNTLNPEFSNASAYSDEELEEIKNMMEKTVREVAIRGV